MFYVIKFVFYWLFLGRSPHEHHYSDWQGVQVIRMSGQDNVVPLRVFKFRIEIIRICKTCGRLERKVYETPDRTKEEIAIIDMHATLDRLKYAFDVVIEPTK